jgi:AbrB family looped-hinge helix DNA binding protein
MEIALTKMSSKGQVVIPLELREDIKEGEKLLVIKNGHQLILKKASEKETSLQDDIEFAKRTEKSLDRYKKGKFKTLDFDDFIETIKKW